MFQVKIFTLYPDFFPGILSKGIYGRAIEKSLWNLDVINIRDYAKDKHKTVDDTPYGGGEGMVLKPDVVAKALDQNLKKNEKIIYLTPKPSSTPFAKKGQKIKKGDTICLIEAMKTFNEIKSDRDCTIKTVMIKNGEAVEFGQPLFEIS